VNLLLNKKLFIKLAFQLQADLLRSNPAAVSLYFSILCKIFQAFNIQLVKKQMC
jgi:hypothetical protein